MSAHSNLSIRERNILHSLGLDDDDAHAAFFRARDKGESAVSAEAFAHEYKALRDSVSPMLSLASQGHGLSAIPADLLGFIMERHWFYRFPSKGART